MSSAQDRQDGPALAGGTVAAHTAPKHRDSRRRPRSTLRAQAVEQHFTRLSGDSGRVQVTRPRAA